MDELIEQIDEKLKTNENLEVEIKKVLEQYRTRLKIKGLEDLHGKTFIIPSYQRGYRWTKDNVTKLLNDLSNFGKKLEEKSEDIDYCLQPIIVKKIYDPENNEKKYELIDGQQRLTTLLLIINELELKENFYNIEYETKGNIIEIIKKEEIENQKDESIDSYYINNAKQIIKNIIGNKEKMTDEKKKQIKNIKNVITNDKNPKSKIKFLWYEIGENDNPNEIFSRINDGKILLSNAENSKALLLKLESDEKSERFEFKQKTKAMKWDEIENFLENDEFWYFLTNKELQYKFEKTRIDLIFDIYEKLLEKKEEKGKKEKINNVFDYIEDEVYSDVNNKDLIWNEIKSIYECIREWYDDSELYHLVGYLICISKGTYIDEIAELKEQYRTNDTEDTKNKFKKYLYTEIKRDLDKEYKKYLDNPNCPIENDGKEKHSIKKIVEGVRYCDEGRNIIKKILLLFNILSMIDTEERISFNKYKEEEWNIEHIYPVHDNIEVFEDIKKEKEIELAKNSKRFLNELCQSEENTEQIKKIEDCIKDLENFIKESNKEENNIENFKEIVLQIDEIFSNSKSKMDEETKNSIGNLTLLNETINKGYQNDFFVLKRKIIIDKVKKIEEISKVKNKKAMNSREFYILPCTERAFLKFYSPKIIQNNIWDINDAKNYKNAIIETLDKIKNKLN